MKKFILFALFAALMLPISVNANGIRRNFVAANIQVGGFHGVRQNFVFSNNFRANIVAQPYNINRNFIVNRNFVAQPYIVNRNFVAQPYVVNRNFFIAQPQQQYIQPQQQFSVQPQQQQQLVAPEVVCPQQQLQQINVVPTASLQLNVRRCY